ncbi:sensor histidine kinase [Gordoniibacillus kamchatkensis]|uniref:sensor histidine kinase n=1 Tax=Gordoniibacillus kamchatkensis TaxID=1590651 RepID=UPI0006978D8F|nr:ATP-binding protein [Paenibacillus sp. VKM B-2647]
MTQQLALQAQEVRMLNERLQELNRGLEASIANRTEELKQSNENLARKAAELVRMDAARRKLLSNISHELRTPMTSIRGYVEAILDNLFATAEEQRHYLQLVLSKMIGLSRLIADLFELSKLESGQPDLHFRTVPVAVFLERTRQKHEPDVVHSGLRFVWSEDGLKGLAPHVSVVLDPERIDQVLTNLISNAVRYTPPNGEIRLRFAVRQGQRGGEPAQELVVEVEDTGSGIAEQDLPFIFERFYRGKDRAPGGSGLGLAIAKEIVTYHGGSLWVHNREGAGSVFGFTLLLYEETES